MGCEDVQGHCPSNPLLSGSGIHCWGAPKSPEGYGENHTFSFSLWALGCKAKGHRPCAPAGWIDEE